MSGVGRGGGGGGGLAEEELGGDAGSDVAESCHQGSREHKLRSPHVCQVGGEREEALVEMSSSDYSFRKQVVKKEKEQRRAAPGGGGDGELLAEDGGYQNVSKDAAGRSPWGGLPGTLGSASRHFSSARPRIPLSNGPVTAPLGSRASADRGWL